MSITATHAAKGPVLTDWRPEDSDFWQKTGKRVANRNLMISVPCLLLAFAVWMVWSVVVARLPAIGFAFTTDQLFLLAALPGLSGATLRIFYSFVIPIFGGGAGRRFPQPRFCCPRWASALLCKTPKRLMRFS